MTVQYLSLQDVASRIGKTRDATSKLQLPEPDVVVGSDLNARRGWLPETIDAWASGREPIATLRERVIARLEVADCTVQGLADEFGATYNAVYQTLTRMLRRGEVARVAGKWELAETEGNWPT